MEAAAWLCNASAFASPNGAHEESFSRVIVSCERDNVASLRVIEANGGVFAPDIEKRSAVYEAKATFGVPTKESHSAWRSIG
jgi:RimJ/RimL family protein N-acetyltransferase